MDWDPIRQKFLVVMAKADWITVFELLPYVNLFSAIAAASKTKCMSSSHFFRVT